MRITTKGRYALRAMLRLAIEDNGKNVSIARLAETESISAEFLEQLFYKMKKESLIISTRGPGGGFRLNRGAHEITVKEILDAVDEGTSLTPCTDCRTDRASCPSHGFWEGTIALLENHFSSVTLQDILNDFQKD